MSGDDLIRRGDARRVMLAYASSYSAEEAETAIAALPAVTPGAGVKPDRETFDAMCAMRDSINEHIPMPSLESDLLQGPENSIFCATVAEAVIAEVLRLRSSKVRQLEWHNFDAWTHWAEGACGTYHVEERNGYWQVELRVGGLVHGVTDTEDTTPEDLNAAKAAAQADYEARILAALDLTQQPAPDVARLVEAAHVIRVWKEDDFFIAHDTSRDIIAQGLTMLEAWERIAETIAVETYGAEVTWNAALADMEGKPAQTRKEVMPDETSNDASAISPGVTAGAQPAPDLTGPDEGFAALIRDAFAEADKAMRKFPQPNYVISKVAEEAGEVVKAAIHCAEGRETVENLRGEMCQAIAMLYRLWVEGDQVHGLPPVRAALADMEGKP